MRSQQKCDTGILTQFLNNELSAIEQDGVEQHLDDCAQCRAELDRIAAEPSWWNEARDYLDGDERLAASTAAMAAEHETLTINCLPFLAPTDDPHMLGRLGTYEIAGIIGSGGMGVVLKGFDSALNRYVAIKVLAPHLATSGAARKRFAREAQAAAAVVHENIIAIHNVAEANGLPYLVMPYVRGASLQRRLSDDGCLDATEVLRVGMQTSRGLAAAHAQGLVHRDIKPANILLDEGTERVKITDFGLARAADDASLTHTGVIAGTPQFMSPEQACGESIDHRSDLFSLGSMLYAMCTGRPPFRAETGYGVISRIRETEPRPIQDINESIPPWLCYLVQLLHAKSPDERLGSAAEAADLMEQCLAHLQQPTSEPLPELLQKIPSTKGPRRYWLGGAAAAVLAVLATIVLIIVSNNRAEKDLLPAENEGWAKAGPTIEDPLETEWGDDMDRRLSGLRSDMTQLETKAEKTLIQSPLAPVQGDADSTQRTEPNDSKSTRRAR